MLANLDHLCIKTCPSPLSLLINVESALAFYGQAKGTNIDWWGGVKFNVYVLFDVSKFISEFQSQIFEIVN